ncbi:MAG: heparinase II/III family protein, partial [Alphaproteobacteria bacterium]|nr:heparinase II/III family protein [Alphaproteobacteria bacterium]
PVYRRTLDGRVPASLSSTPDWLLPGDAAIADRLFQGRWRLAGDELADARHAPFDLPPPSRAFAVELHRFGWLRHFAASGGAAARRQARALVSHWLARYGEFEPALWAPELLAPRLARWIGHAGFLMADSDDTFRAAFLRGLARQSRHLRRSLGQIGDEATRFQAGLALTLAALVLGGSRQDGARGLELVEAALARLLLPDGCHASRRADELLVLLAEILTLRQALEQAGREVPLAIGSAIERAAPALRFLRHGDGSLALFNGTRPWPAPAIDQVLARTGSRARAERNLPDGGYERLQAGRSLLLLDAGRPALASAPAHAGLLSIEFSIGRRRVVVNCGASERREGDWASAMRASAAHSTLVLADQNSLVLDAQGCPAGDIAEIVHARAETEEHLMVEATHGGYAARFGLSHRRRLWLGRNGEDLYGEDALIGPGRGAPDFAIRFHLHPDVQVSLLQDGQSALLRLSASHGLRFRAANAALSLEESVYFGDPGRIARTRQLVLAGSAGQAASPVTWHIGRMQ